MAIYALGDQVPRIDPTAYIHPDAVIIGDVRIGPQASVWPAAVLRGDDGYIEVGARSSIQDGAVLHTTAEVPTVVGDECVVGHCVHLEGCRLHDRVLAGSNCTILVEAEIHSVALVGANALVPGGMVVPSGAMALGVPARLRPDTVDLEMVMFGVRNYVQRAERFRRELRRLDPPGSDGPS